ncbi:DUF1073 domain-containing protein [Pseudodesulfovibrio sp.]|uniref:DUF1073 domain-containing protein n=1 Tax=Pseudodesulfovibrio sp. TaxID=2035812 RepID=UPI002638DC61|nr:DUF1073 domain-containing protein [Pseudodesulfovibrio sp.]MDD3310964.1 DUF1073 domain-containing protein [Pseudodesulfovibrio sp.]
MGRRKDYRPGGKNFPTTDGFDNFVAKLGMGQSNPLAAGTYTRGRKLTAERTVLDEMYRTSWVVGRMVDVVAEDMVRGGIDIQSELPPGDVDELLRYMQRMGVNARLSDAIKWSRLYGGAIAVILIDGADPSSPLRLDAICRDAFKGLHVLDRHQVTPSSEVVLELGPMLGYPEFYTVYDMEGSAGLRFHHSRVIRFVGVELPYYERIAEQSWGASVVERAYERIVALDSATHGSANLIMRSYLRTIGIEGLREVIAAGGPAEKALLKMFNMLRLMQTNEGLTLLDAKDTFTTHSWTFTGVYDALQAFAEQIAGATGIPLVRLLGQSPKGFSTGESDLRSYYDTIATDQDDDLRPALEKLLPVCAMSLWGNPLPEGTQFAFRSLWQPTEVDKSTIATNDAQAVAGLFAAGLITEAEGKAELRNSGRLTGRFGGITDESIEAAETSAAPAPVLGDEPGDYGPVEESGHTPQEISLNGAQVASMMEIVASVAMGTLPRESGVEMLLAAFPLDRSQAEQIMGRVGRGFVPASNVSEDVPA